MGNGLGLIRLQRPAEGWRTRINNTGQRSEEKD